MVMKFEQHFVRVYVSRMGKMFGIGDKFFKYNILGLLSKTQITTRTKVKKKV